MNTSKVANVLQILANLGIVAGLIMVGIQINQNTQIAQADLNARGFEQVSQYQLTMMGESPSKALAKASTNPDELTDEEMVVLGRIFTFWLNLDTQAEIELEMGLVDREIQLNYWKERAESVYGSNPVFAAMWKEFRKDKDGVWEWIGIVDEKFRDIEHDRDSRQLQLLREVIRDK